MVRSSTLMLKNRDVILKGDERELIYNVLVIVTQKPHNSYHSTIQNSDCTPGLPKKNLETCDQHIGIFRRFLEQKVTGRSYQTSSFHPEEHRRFSLQCCHPDAGKNNELYKPNHQFRWLAHQVVTSLLSGEFYALVSPIAGGTTSRTGVTIGVSRPVAVVVCKSN